jgi:2-polyprenyl-3-methyl-5-hydroxy-6-metoxy-1,4-benzoquinol methylase
MTESNLAVRAAARPVNPHFDDGRFIWKDAFSGGYRPVPYCEQFDDQWRYFLEKRTGFHRHTGVETADSYIDDRIFELTGVAEYLSRKRFGPLYGVASWWRRRAGGETRRDVGGRLYLEPKFAIDHFRGKRCLDLGCGPGRWTRTLMVLGASVKSTDVSRHALLSASRFNRDVEELDLFDILERRTDLHAAFDFTLCWGVLMCTHDPRLAFANAAKTVKPGGELYVMVYAPTYHTSDFVVESRRFYHANLATSQEKLDYAYRIANAPENAINLLDMLNTFYNWTIEEETVHNWFAEAGFTGVITLNCDEADKCAYHVWGCKA